LIAIIADISTDCCIGAIDISSIAGSNGGAAGLTIIALSLPFFSTYNSKTGYIVD